MKSTESEICKRLYEINEAHKSNLNRTDDVGQNDDDELIFLFLERELQARSLTHLNQLPIKEVTDIVQLVNSLPADPHMFSLLQKIKLTEFLEFPRNQTNNTTSRSKTPLQSPYLTGTGFNSTFDRSTQCENIFIAGDLCYPSVIGFSLPTQITCERIGRLFNIFKVFRSHDSYVANRLKELRLPSGLQFKGHPKCGHNISHNKSYADIAFTFVREYRLFSLTINPTAELNPDFVTRVKEISTYSVDDYFGLKQWEEFFNTHGTHVVQSSNGGGKIVITILENHLKNFFKTEELYKKEKEIEELISNYLDCETENKTFETPIISSIKLIGGDTKFEHVDLKDSIEMRSLLKEWVNSLPFRPAMLDSVLTLESIPDILDRHDMPADATLFDNASKKLMGKSFRTGTNSKLSLDDHKISRWGFW